MDGDGIKEDFHAGIDIVHPIKGQIYNYPVYSVGSGKVIRSSHEGLSRLYGCNKIG